MSNFNSDVVNLCEIDNLIKNKNNEMKILREKRDLLEKNIIYHIEANNLQDNVFNISSMNTKIEYSKNNIKETITMKFLENTIEKFYNNDIDKTKNLIEFIKNNRKTNEKVTLKRK